MKAIVRERYGSADVLELKDIAEPNVNDDQVLVRAHAASVNPADWHIMRGDPYIARLSYGLRGPQDRVLGCDVAGRVEAVGSNVTTLQPGDEVFGTLFGRGFGGFAESYAFASNDPWALKPSGLSYEESAAVPLAGLTALQGLRDHGRIEPAQRVLVIGASGGVGTFAVQIAKALGGEVTGLCSTRNLELVRSIGADHVIDYTGEDYTERTQSYDLVLQLAGTRPPAHCRRALTPDGTLVSISGDSRGHWIGPLGRLARARALSPFVSQRMVSFTTRPEQDDLKFLSGLIEAGEVRPVIDRTYPLAEVPAAIRYLERGHARGKIVITI